MEFVDLKQQYQRYKAEIDAGIRPVLDHGHYIIVLGPEIVELEEALTRRKRTGCGVSPGSRE